MTQMPPVLGATRPFREKVQAWERTVDAVQRHQKLYRTHRILVNESSANHGLVYRWVTCHNGGVKNGRNWNQRARRHMAVAVLLVPVSWLWAAPAEAQALDWVSLNAEIRRSTRPCKP